MWTHHDKNQDKWITSSDINPTNLTSEKDIMQIPTVIEKEIVRSSKALPKYGYQSLAAH